MSDKDTRQIPEISEHCSARYHIPAKFFAVYDFALAVSRGKGGGYCWLTSRVLEDWICGLPQRQAFKAIAWLVKHDWLRVMIEPTNRRGGQYEVQDHVGYTLPTKHGGHGEHFCKRCKQRKKK